MGSAFVPGKAQPQGSHRIAGRLGQRGRIVDSNAALIPWRDVVKLTVSQVLWQMKATAPQFVDGDALQLGMHFVLPRRAKESTPPTMHTRKPDLDKLVRAVDDALTDTLMAGDQQVVSIYTTKRTATPELLAGLYLFWAACPELPPIPKDIATWQ